MNRKIIAIGAEAVLYLEDWLGLTVLVKERLPKGYRRVEFDNYIRRSRTINETRAMIRARELGIHVPRIYDVDPVNMRIRMEYLNGVPLVRLLMSSSNGFNAAIISYIRTMGSYIGVLHRNGIVHGDPTPANVLIVGDKLYIIDFGLSETLGRAPTIQDVRMLYKLALDLNVTLRSLEALRKDQSHFLFAEFLSGYESVLGFELTGRVKAIVNKVRKMVRYSVR
ncbi:KEOPS complex kinase/ATPase Bud32 [Vulcanisaeta souniana]|uniref:non-specific serine/threonine protein kinase n=1 Tax=Vulcanisaeta souniana JCM 11219 TaxID=1293586 RepID=A0A830E9S8_9CREN|nr:KEOPS complex kinase/ATPase Bud32 [Vulcanisaeta souniana]BDR91253.1 Kae1-associated kinase Bud32 [Vulcanisaeta souniana JCM 11219]GGI85076.1 Kae1-associated kinase Bud32 [Vulcanisaeta souniana JCM 11219]